MRILLPLILALTPAAAAAPDLVAPSLAADSEARWVPFTPTPGNQIQFAVTIDGKPVNAILDTGASRSFLTQAFTTQAGLKIARRGRVAAIGGAVATGWTKVGTIAFGGLSRAGGGLDVVTLPGNVTGGVAAIDMIVGRDLVGRYAIDLDYASRRFRLLPSGRLPFAGARAPLHLVSAPLAYVTELSIAGRRVRPVIVDTGDGTALTLARSAWRTLPLPDQPVMTTQLAYGAGGSVIADIGILPQLTIGQQAVRDVPVWVEQTGGFSETARSAGRIGSGLLQRYRVLLDPGAGHMILGAGGIDTPLPRSTSGFQLGLARGELQVLHVMRGSPAAAGGWKVGERICAVDGQRVADDAAAVGRDWPFGAPGRVVRLTLCDGSVRDLTLRRFY